MTNRSIGKIVSINSKKIIAEVFNNIGSYLNVSEGIVFVGEIGSYVSIEEINRVIVCEIIGIEDKNQTTTLEFSKPYSTKYMYLDLIGEIKNCIFTFGVSQMPLIFSDVEIISENNLKIMHEIGAEEIPADCSEDNKNTRQLLLPLGKAVLFKNFDVKINIDKFFGFHFAVFGNTGAGKSNTIARTIQNIFCKNNYSAKGAKFVIIDSNGEYEKAFENFDNANISSKTLTTDFYDDTHDKLEIPIWALSADDWGVLLHASEKTQLPLLKRAVDIAKIYYGDSEEDNKLRNHILSSVILGILFSQDSPASKTDRLISILYKFGTKELGLDTEIAAVEKNTPKMLPIRDVIKQTYGTLNDTESLQKYVAKIAADNQLSKRTSVTEVTYDFEEFCEAVSLAILYEGSMTSQRIQEYTATLNTRLQSLKDDECGKIFVRTKYKNMNEYVSSLLDKNQILNIDISSLDDYTSEVVVNVLSKMIFEYLRKQKDKASMPVNLIIEEAHRFVKNTIDYGAVGYNIFERIAKEGRKFGLLLGISSQRPSELSKTVVSQCSNFIIHRVQNPDDLSYISHMVPYINTMMIDRLTYMPTGYALVFGTAIKVPMLTIFDEANPSPDSQNARISEKWYIG